MNKKKPLQMLFVKNLSNNTYLESCEGYWDTKGKCKRDPNTIPWTKNPDQALRLKKNSTNDEITLDFLMRYFDSQPSLNVDVVTLQAKWVAA
jgi:hypothetical protein